MPRRAISLLLSKATTVANADGLLRACLTTAGAEFPFCRPLYRHNKMELSYIGCIRSVKSSNNTVRASILFIVVQRS